MSVFGVCGNLGGRTMSAPTTGPCVGRDDPAPFGKRALPSGGRKRSALSSPCQRAGGRRRRWRGDSVSRKSVGRDAPARRSTTAPYGWSKAPLLEGGHGKAVAGGVLMGKSIVNRCVTPSATAAGGASSLKEGALEDGVFDKRKGPAPWAGPLSICRRIPPGL